MCICDQLVNCGACNRLLLCLALCPWLSDCTVACSSIITSTFSVLPLPLMLVWQLLFWCCGVSMACERECGVVVTAVLAVPLCGCYNYRAAAAATAASATTTHSTQQPQQHSYSSSSNSRIHRCRCVRACICFSHVVHNYSLHRSSQLHSARKQTISRSATTTATTTTTAATAPPQHYSGSTIIITISRICTHSGCTIHSLDLSTHTHLVIVPIDHQRAAVATATATAAATEVPQSIDCSANTTTSRERYVNSIYTRSNSSIVCYIYSFRNQRFR